MSHPTEIYIPQVINQVEGPLQEIPLYQVATTNEDKLAEMRRILGVEVVSIPLQVDEVQDYDPLVVASKKAYQAWLKNEQRSMVIEDSSLQCLGLEDNLPGPSIDQWADTVGKRRLLSQMVPEDDRRAIFQVTLALFDGYEVQYRVGKVTGTIADKPRGSGGFGFDDIFEPDGQDILPNWDGTRRTYAEMTPEEKDMLSPRRIALEKLRDEPFQVGKCVYMLPEPPQLETDAIRLDELNDEGAIAFAFSLEGIEENNPLNPCFETPNYAPIRVEEYAAGEIIRYTATPDSPSMGLIITPYDTAKNHRGEPRRLLTDVDGYSPILWQMGAGRRKIALASRAEFFLSRHNNEAYRILRGIRNGEVKIEPRPNFPDDRIEAMLKIVRRNGRDTFDKEMVEVFGVAALAELAYARESAEKSMSRTHSADYGMYHMFRKGQPRGFISGGRMPQFGFRDILAFLVINHMVGFVPRNGWFYGNIEKKVRLIEEVFSVVDRMEIIPDDIRQISRRNLGVALGCEDPQAVVEEMEVYWNAGCRLATIYSTNPDPRKIETALRLRNRFGEELELWSGPTTDIKEGRRLSVHPEEVLEVQNPLLPLVDGLIFAHGEGELCESLLGGAAANSLELMYLASLEPDFAKVGLIREGGTGMFFGPVMARCDGIIYHARLHGATIEMGGGLLVEHVDGNIVFPRHGDASAVNARLEAVFGPPEAAGRNLNSAGRVENVEGKPSYVYGEKAYNSIADKADYLYTAMGRTLANRDVTTYQELREKLNSGQKDNLRLASPTSVAIAQSHRDSGL